VALDFTRPQFQDLHLLLFQLLRDRLSRALVAKTKNFSMKSPFFWIVGSFGSELRPAVMENFSETYDEYTDVRPWEKYFVPSLKLLVVEDDASSLELMREVFTSLEAEVCAVGHSENAATLINQRRFDGIFLDLGMPSPDGFQLARLVRKSGFNKSTPIVIVTGVDDKKVMEQAFSIGATFFLQKPIDRQKLSRLFRTVRGGMLDNRRRHIRVPLRGEVLLGIGSKSVRAESWNLSEGGMQVEADGLQSREKVHVSFRLHVPEVAIEVEGVVAWVNQNRQGIQFTSVSEQNQQAIRKFIASAER
jgi:CheY-like chemotaxis protein